MNVTYHKEKRDWTIYKITNPNGGVYVGKSCVYKSRVGSYKSTLAKGQPLLHYSFLKYGFDSHNFEILEEFYSDISLAKAKEIFWIRTNVCNRTKFRNFGGLNLSDGGEGSLNRLTSDETRKKMSIYNKGKKLSEETKRKIGLAHIGLKKPSRVVSEETKKKISLKTKGFKFNEKQLEKAKKNAMQYHAKKIFIKNINSGEETEYLSVSDAIYKTGISKTSFYRIINKKTSIGSELEIKYI